MHSVHNVTKLLYDRERERERERERDIVKGESLTGSKSASPRLARRITCEVGKEAESMILTAWLP